LYPLTLQESLKISQEAPRQYPAPTSVKLADVRANVDVDVGADVGVDVVTGAWAWRHKSCRSNEAALFRPFLLNQSFTLGDWLL
jgi:hypothetical protein